MDGTLLTDRVVELSPLTVVDAAEHLAGQDAQLRRWLHTGPGTTRGSVTWLSRCEEGWTSGGPVFAFGVRDAGLRSLLGTVELRVGERALEPGQASISHGLYPQARGRGIAVRACRLACCFALTLLADEPWNVAEVVAQIDPMNAASLRMIERVGFVHAGSRVGAGQAWELFVMDRPRLEATSQWPPGWPSGWPRSDVGAWVSRGSGEPRPA
jgi:RimJ/RimL family protein N-acetyltransferase